jgi:hypothetical protein
MSDDSYPKLFCVNHPDRETLLRCNSCERPICTQCAVQTPTGYRCKDCMRGLQKRFDSSTNADYPVAIGIAVVFSFLGSLLAPILGFFTVFIAPVAGGLIAETVRWAVKKRRSRNLFISVAVAAAVGALPLLLFSLLPLLMGSLSGILRLVWQAVYAGLVVTTAYYRLRGIEIR